MKDYDIDLITKVCNLRYREEKSQKEISELLKISQAKVSRLMKKALELGILKISIIDNKSELSGIESQLEKKFGLRRAIVAQSGNYSEKELKLILGQKAANYMENIIKDNDVIGISHGSTVKEVISALPIRLPQKVDVVQILGGSYQLLFGNDGTDLTKDFSQRFNINPHILLAPLFVDNKKIRDAILEDSNIKVTLRMFKKINIAIVGIGTFYPILSSSIFKLGNLNRKEIRELRAKNVAGDVFGHFINGSGDFCETSVGDRVISITGPDIFKIDYRIGIAGGENKFKAIAGALKKKMVNIIVTDDRVAKLILKNS
ncbi:MAG: sugar-binding transcriptional regulator [Candidatus Humimicrobiaceae bacterium]